MITFIDLFSGIGGFRRGFELAGMKCIGYCEADKFAKQSYDLIHDTDGEWYSDDISKVKPSEIPKADIWTFGFPCQDISIAGKAVGIEKGKRSSLFFKVMELVNECTENKPRFLVAENVRNLLSINSGWDFYKVLCEMDRGGGTMLNGVLTTQKSTEYRTVEIEYSLSDILEEQVPVKYYLSQEKVNSLLNKSAIS